MTTGSQSQIWYFLCVVLTVYICSSVQAIYLAQTSLPWLHIDFVSIIIVYLCLEHSVLFSAIIAIIAGLLMQANVSSPHVFFILYFMLMVVFANIIASFFVVRSLFSKGIIFSVLYLIKYILFYFSLNNRYEVGISTLISVYWREYVATAIAAFFFYKLLLHLDTLFLLPGSIKKR